MTALRWPWEGEIVRVHEDGSWEFYRCAHCHRPLTDEASKRRGYGPGCARRSADVGLLVMQREEARRRDRKRYRNRLDVVRILSRPGRIEDEGIVG